LVSPAGKPPQPFPPLLYVPCFLTAAHPARPGRHSLHRFLDDLPHWRADGRHDQFEHSCVRRHARWVAKAADGWQLVLSGCTEAEEGCCAVVGSRSVQLPSQTPLQITDLHNRLASCCPCSVWSACRDQLHLLALVLQPDGLLVPPAQGHPAGCAAPAARCCTLAYGMERPAAWCWLPTNGRWPHGRQGGLLCPMEPIGCHLQHLEVPFRNRPCCLLQASCLPSSQWPGTVSGGRFGAGLYAALQYNKPGTDSYSATAPAAFVMPIMLWTASQVSASGVWGLGNAGGRERLAVGVRWAGRLR